jgi:transposase
MISFNRLTKIFVSRAPADMRASYDSLFSKVKEILKQDPFSGHVFIFMNGKRTSIKCLFYDGTGLVLICKRLENGMFSQLNSIIQGEIVLTPAEFGLFFEGASLNKKMIDHRFVESPREIKKIIPNESRIATTV